MNNAHTSIPSIFVADDEPDLRELISEVLRSEGYQVTEYNPHNPDPETLTRSYDVALVDIVMPHKDGFALRNEMLRYSSGAQFIIMTAFPDPEKHEKAVEAGAFTFLIKPFGADHIRYAVRGALRKKTMLASSCVPKEVCAAHLGLVGDSHHLKSVRQRIRELAPLEIPVLIQGESGTGKEIVARGIHNHSARAAKPFIAINCGSLNPSLIESELFGHAQGSFTGAHKTKHGLFEAAEGGTLFLDEIGELPLELQSKFLRILDTGEYMRIGETVQRKGDTRIISATNREIERMVADGRFRKDLYYRLKGGMVSMLPLRDRKEDIRPIINFYLDEKTVIRPEAMEALERYDWPGNVRELCMTLKNLKSVCNGNAVTEDMVEQILGTRRSEGAQETLESYQRMKSWVLQDFDTKYFKRLLSATEGNLSRAAYLAEIDRKNLREKMKKLGLYEKFTIDRQGGRFTGSGLRVKT